MWVARYACKIAADKDAETCVDPTAERMDGGGGSVGKGEKERGLHSPEKGCGGGAGASEKGNGSGNGGGLGSVEKAEKDKDKDPLSAMM